MKKVWFDGPVPTLLCGHKHAVHKRRRFGIELEFENYPVVVDDPLPGWAREVDMSLRNNGIELISSPLLLTSVQRKLDLVTEFIDKMGVEATNRCGVHVHMNVGNLTVRELWCLLTTYLLAEPAIFKKWAPERVNSHFCTPLFSQTQYVSRLENDARLLRRAELRKTPEEGLYPQFNLTHGVKYSALNLRTIRNIQTAEFRHLPGTTDMDHVMKWVEFLDSLADYAKEFKDPVDVVDEWEEIGKEFLRPLDLADEIIDEEDTQDAYEMAVLMCGHGQGDFEPQPERPQPEVRVRPRVDRARARLIDEILADRVVGG